MAATRGELLAELRYQRRWRGFYRDQIRSMRENCHNWWFEQVDKHNGLIRACQQRLVAMRSGRPA